MNGPQLRRRRWTWLWVSAGLAVALFLYLGIECRLMGQCRPPDHVKTVDDFRAWQGDAVTARGYYDHEGQRYLVLMTSHAALLSSGPAAYLFAEDGMLADWTADMGDFRTVRNGFAVSSGHVVVTLRE